MIIAIDGPSGAGKSTIARGLGKKLGLFFLDTGAMYRSIALEVLRQGADLDSEEAVAQIARDIELHFDGDGNITVNGACVAKEIREESVENIVSQVAAYSMVRQAIVPKQKAIAEEQGGVVAEGRDMTSVVFVDSKFRFYLDASAQERARRRAEQRGTPEKAGEIQRALEARDRIDSGRADSPLHLADGVRHVETDSKTADQVIEIILSYVQSTPE